MGNKKKRGRPDIDELLARPWCYYCERDFDDLKILIDHQRAKHFKCDRCGRRLNTAGGLSVHLTQVHKETLTSIENALPNRSNLDVEIFGTEGIPQDVAEAHRQRVLTQYAQAEAERRAATGNPTPGASNGESVAKKPKIESKEDIKKRMAEFKAKKAAGIQQGGSSVSSPSTPGPVETQYLPLGTTQQMPGVPQQQAYTAFPQPYGAPAPGFHSVPAHIANFSSPPGPPFQQTFAPPQPYGNNVPGGFAPSGQFAPVPAPGSYPGGAPQGYGVQSPPMPFGQHGQFQPPRMNSPQHGAPPPSAGPVNGGIRSPSGLPPRPVSGAPPVNSAVMQQMHQGQYNPPHHTHPSHANGSADSATPPAAAPLPETPVPASGAKPALPVKPTSAPIAKKSKKDDKIRMMYSDNEVSPEEKLAKLPRYHFERSGLATETVLDSSFEANAGVVAPASMDDFANGNGA